MYDENKISMKNRTFKRIVLLICIMMHEYNLHSEYLIVKRDGQNYRPLDHTDEVHHPAICNILLRYKWPMNITNDTLTAQERHALLAPADQGGNEEEFIRRKIQKINPAYDIAFIPDALFELFAIQQAQKNKIYSNNPSKLRIEFKSKSFHPLQEFDEANQNSHPNDFIALNNQLTKYLLENYGSLQSIEQPLSMNIQKNTTRLTKSIKKQMMDESPSDKRSSFHIMNSLEEDFDNKILDQCINIEYNHHALNKASLFRGTKPIKTPNQLKRSVIQDSLIMGNELEINGNPYSVSFGNSLFAGAFNDLNACAYHILLTQSLNQISGYALSLNKESYTKDACGDLFFISPLSSLPALYSSGEVFHSRTKLIKTENPPKEWYNYIQGINIPSLYLKDYDHLSEKDMQTQEHAEFVLSYMTSKYNNKKLTQKFSKCLMDDMTLIVSDRCTPEFMAMIHENQRLLHAQNLFNHALPRLQKKYKEIFAIKKAHFEHKEHLTPALKELRQQHQARIQKERDDIKCALLQPGSFQATNTLRQIVVGKMLTHTQKLSHAFNQQDLDTPHDTSWASKINTPWTAEKALKSANYVAQKYKNHPLHEIISRPSMTEID